jgi:hypothetical protein
VKLVLLWNHFWLVLHRKGITGELTMQINNGKDGELLWRFYKQMKMWWVLQVQWWKEWWGK